MKFAPDVSRTGEMEEKRILVVDDDAAIRTLLFTVLQRRGMAVDTARNGAEALDRLRDCRYVLMLLDLMMPVLSGFEVLDRLAEFDPAARPMVILLTAGSEPRDFNPDIVFGTVRKPFDVELLHDTITACVSTLSPLEQPPACPLSESDRKPRNLA